MVKDVVLFGENLFVYFFVNRELFRNFCTFTQITMGICRLNMSFRRSESSSDIAKADTAHKEHACDPCCNANTLLTE